MQSQCNIYFHKNVITIQIWIKIQKNSPPEIRDLHSKDSELHWEKFWNVHTEKYFLNLIKSSRNQIAFTIFRFIWNQTDVRLVPEQSENGK